MPTTELLDPAESVEVLAGRPEWTDSVFTTTAWWRAAVTLLAEGRDLRIAAITDGTRVAGLLGVVVDPERHLTRLVGDPVTDRTGPLHCPADRPAVASELAGLLDVLVPDHSPFRTDGLHPGFHRADPAGTVVEVPCPAVRLGRSWDDYLSGPHARRRRRIAARSAELLARSDVVVAEHTTPSGVAGAFDVLATLHELRFGSDHGLFRGRLGRFLRQVVLDLAVHGGAAIRTMHVRERPAAALLLLRHDRVASFYQGGWDPTFAGLSVGRALFAETLRCEFERARSSGGPTTFELLRGVEPYKAYWSDHHDTVLELSRPSRDGRQWPEGFTA